MSLSQIRGELLYLASDPVFIYESQHCNELPSDADAAGLWATPGATAT